MKCDPLTITTPFIRLDSALKLCGEAETGGYAKIIIQSGLVRVDGTVCSERGKKLYPGSRVLVKDHCYEVVAGEG